MANTPPATAAAATSPWPWPPLRPWSSFLSPSSLSLPLHSLTSRLTTNLSHFLLNYIFLSLFVFPLSLILRPVSFSAPFLFLVALVAWSVLYVNRRHDFPLLVLGRTIDHPTVLVVLSVLTLLALVYVDVWGHVFATLAVSTALIVLHAAVRDTNGLLQSGSDSPRGGFTLLVPIV